MTTTNTTAYIGTTVSVEADYGFRHWVTFEVTNEAESAEVSAYIARLESEGVLSDVEVVEADEADEYDEPYEDAVEHDAWVLESAGWGPDEAYNGGDYGDEWLDAGADW